MPAVELSNRTQMPQPSHPVSRHDTEPSEGRKRYFVHLRMDVLAMVPESAVSVLSVGCGSGRTEAELVRRGCRVTGIEMDADAAAAAAENGLDMLTGDVNEISARLAGRRFDCLLYADVLEHIANPESVLKEHVALLDPGGCVILSVPNFRHYECFLRLFLRGDIAYEDAGIFDRTHLRITTRKLVERWVMTAGLVPRPATLVASRQRERLAMRLLPGRMKELVARQILLAATKPQDS